MGKQIQLKDLPPRPENPIKIWVGRDEYVLYHHIDGMYSYCTEGDTDNVVHLHIGTPLLQVGDDYKVI